MLEFKLTIFVPCYVGQVLFVYLLYVVTLFNEALCTITSKVRICLSLWLDIVIFHHHTRFQWQFIVFGWG